MFSNGIIVLFGLKGFRWFYINEDVCDFSLFLKLFNMELFLLCLLVKFYLLKRLFNLYYVLKKVKCVYFKSNDVNFVFALD